MSASLLRQSERRHETSRRPVKAKPRCDGEMECKVHIRQLKLDAVIIAPLFGASSPSLVMYGTILTPPLWGRSGGGGLSWFVVDYSVVALQSRGALGKSTAERVFEIPSSIQGLGQGGS